MKISADLKRIYFFYMKIGFLAVLLMDADHVVGQFQADFQGDVRPRLRGGRLGLGREARRRVAWRTGRSHRKRRSGLVRAVVPIRSDGRWAHSRNQRPAHGQRLRRMELRAVGPLAERAEDVHAGRAVEPRGGAYGFRSQCLCAHRRRAQGQEPHRRQPTASRRAAGSDRAGQRCTA